MGFVRESSKKYANPFESSANPLANPLDFSPQQLRFLVRAGPTLMRILREYLRILWSSPHSNLVFWYKPEILERRLYLASHANCMYYCGCIVFWVFFWLSVKVTWGTFACSVTQKPFSLLAKAVTLRVKLQSTKPIGKLHAQAAHIEVLVNVRHSFLQPLRELIRRLLSRDFQGPAASSSRMDLQVTTSRMWM